MALGGAAAALGSLALWLRSPGGGSVVTLVVVAVGAAAAVYLVVAVAVRPRATPAGTAYLVLTPSGSLSRYGLQVTNPDATIPGRLVVSEMRSPGRSAACAFGSLTPSSSASRYAGCRPCARSAT